MRATRVRGSRTRWQASPRGATLTTTLQIFEAEPSRLPAQSLRDGQVDVWCLNADPAEPLPVDLQDMLDADERARAGRFVVPDHRPRFVLAHGMVRVVLAAYLDRAPESLVFETGPRGKPHLRGVGLSFNLSHSHDAIVLAVAQGLVLGVDVERLRRLEDRDGLVGRFFSAREQAAFAALPVGDRDEAFFRLWTRKEAYIKALGDGLSCPLDSFSVSCDTQARILEPALPRWSLHHLEPWTCYVGALAVEHPAPLLRIRRLMLSGRRLTEAATAG